MKRLVLGMLALVGCSDPGYICDQTGEQIGYDGTCTPARPSIDVDGDMTDWSSLVFFETPCDCAQNGWVRVTHATVTAKGDLAVFAEIVGNPVIDVDHSYYVELEPIDGPYDLFGFRVTPTGVETSLGPVTLTGIPVRAAFGPDGLELTVPINALPFTAAALAGADLDAFTDGIWQTGQDTTPYLVEACWDPSSPFCRPKRHIN